MKQNLMLKAYTWLIITIRVHNGSVLLYTWNRCPSLLFPKVIFVTFGVFKFLFGVI